MVFREIGLGLQLLRRVSVPGVVVISRVDAVLAEALPLRELNAVNVQLFWDGAVDELEY
jgi:hypothetical protein